MQEGHGMQLYLVVPAKQGWAINLGADSIAVFGVRAEALDEAERLVREARARGEAADLVDHTANAPPVPH